MYRPPPPTTGPCTLFPLPGGPLPAPCKPTFLQLSSQCQPSETRGDLLFRSSQRLSSSLHSARPPIRVVNVKRRGKNVLFVGGEAPHGVQVSAAAPAWAPSRRTLGFSGVGSRNGLQGGGRETAGQGGRENNRGHVNGGDRCGRRGWPHWETAARALEGQGHCEFCPPAPISC